MYPRRNVAVRTRSFRTEVLQDDAGVMDLPDLTHSRPQLWPTHMTPPFGQSPAGLPGYMYLQPESTRQCWTTSASQSPPPCRIGTRPRMDHGDLRTQATFYYSPSATWKTCAARC